MRLRYAMLSFFVGILVFAASATAGEIETTPGGVGESVAGIRQAEEWRRAADLALENKQWLVAYSFYRKNAETFPGTRHACLAACRADYSRYFLHHPGRVPSGEDWLREAYDFLTW